MGLFDAFKRTGTKKGFSLRDIFTRIDGSLYQTLEERLVDADAGPDTAREIVSLLKAAVDTKKLRESDAVRAELAAILKQMLHTGTLAIDGKTLLFIVGVNGVGKTTSIAKLASWIKPTTVPLLVAADTFRAAAIEQLDEWATRISVPIVKGQPAGDPAAVLFDALTSAKAKNIDCVIADTAGRFHNKEGLVRQLMKMKTIAVERFPEFRFVPLLVLDATVGQNGFDQAKVFFEALAVQGIILSKFDSSAKGGILFAISRRLSIPVLFIGTGEKPSDISPFNAASFVDGIVSG
ncbi:MAG: signal recognition particle-docking protein FtsY [Spirochaetota bacterium]